MLSSLSCAHIKVNSYKICKGVKGCWNWCATCSKGKTIFPKLVNSKAMCVRHEIRVYTLSWSHDCDCQKFVHIVDNQNLNPAVGGARGDSQNRWPFMGQSKSRIEGQVQRLLSENCHSRHNIGLELVSENGPEMRDKQNIFPCHCRAQSRKGNLSSATPEVFPRLSLVFSKIFPMLAGSHRNFAQG